MKSEKGSVTLIVGATIMFIIIMLDALYTTAYFKNRSQLSELGELKNAYDGDMKTAYLDRVSKDLKKVWYFDYTGSVQEFTAPETGTYKLECWGAQGGDAGIVKIGKGGNGGYSSGSVTLNKNQKIYISVGGAGKQAESLIKWQEGGWNGGGVSEPWAAWNATYSDGYTYTDRNDVYSGADDNAVHVATGGGATSIQKTLIGDGQLANYENTKDTDVYIVAGAGGGGWEYDGGNYYNNGGSGGGLEGIQGSLGEKNGSLSYCYTGTVGTQDSGGAFGQAKNLDFHDSNSGSGGGWYGGYTTSTHSTGVGGSGYIGGVTNGQTIAGNSNMPTHDGTSTMTGNSGNGYAKITAI